VHDAGDEDAPGLVFGFDGGALFSTLREKQCIEF
jgi:hypothetical protein